MKPSDIDVFLSDTEWAISSTNHTVLKASPGAAIFGLGATNARGGGEGAEGQLEGWMYV